MRTYTATLGDLGLQPNTIGAQIAQWPTTPLIPADHGFDCLSVDAMGSTPGICYLVALGGRRPENSEDFEQVVTLTPSGMLAIDPRRPVYIAAVYPTDATASGNQQNRLRLSDSVVRFIATKACEPYLPSPYPFGPGDVVASVATSYAIETAPAAGAAVTLIDAARIRRLPGAMLTMFARLRGGKVHVTTAESPLELRVRLGDAQNTDTYTKTFLFPGGGQYLAEGEIVWPLPIMESGDITNAFAIEVNNPTGNQTKTDWAIELFLVYGYHRPFMRYALSTDIASDDSANDKFLTFCFPRPKDGQGFAMRSDDDANMTYYQFGYLPESHGGPRRRTLLTSTVAPLATAQVALATGAPWNMIRVDHGAATSFGGDFHCEVTA